MNSPQPVIMRRGGFWSALVYGPTAMIIAGMVCGTAVGFYALNIVDRKVTQIFGLSRSVLEVLPKWQEALPPALSEAFQDHRDPAYREHLAVSARLVQDSNGRQPGQRVVVEVENRGPETITLLPVRVVLLDAGGNPMSSTSHYVATPLAIEREWPGPLLPGAKRIEFVRLYGCDMASQVSAEITDLRIWTKAAPAPAAEALPPPGSIVAPVVPVAPPAPNTTGAPIAPVAPTTPVAPVAPG